MKIYKNKVGFENNEIDGRECPKFEVFSEKKSIIGRKFKKIIRALKMPESNLKSLAYAKYEFLLK